MTGHFHTKVAYSILMFQFDRRVVAYARMSTKKFVAWRRGDLPPPVVESDSASVEDVEESRRGRNKKR